MAKGSITFNELNNEDWPGETTALLEKLNLRKYKMITFLLNKYIFYSFKIINEKSFKNLIN